MQTQQVSVELGQTVMTRGISNLLSLHPELQFLIHYSIYRHSKGDWGSLCDDDRKVNDEAVIDGSRLLSSYDFPKYVVGHSKFWIITEADRSVTTVLFPSEY